MKHGRRSMVIYQKWIINGIEYEVDSLMSFLTAAGVGASIVGAPSGNLLTITIDKKRTYPRKAWVDLLTPVQFVERAKQQTCLVMRVIP